MSMVWWLTSMASLLGVVLNIRGRRACFAIWLVTNSTWAVADWIHGIPAQAALQLVYVGFSIYGWCHWRAAAPAPAFGR
jgi:nicotinamide riboside transporter PnuC